MKELKEAIIFITHDDVAEIINLQPNNENKAKPYQVKQVREIIVKYKLAEEPEDESDD